MKQHNFEKLTPQMPFINQWVNNQNIPPGCDVKTTKIHAIWMDEFERAPTRMYCNVCVMEMLNDVKNAYERQERIINETTVEKPAVKEETRQKAKEAGNQKAGKK